jgi:uncharacterized protein YjbI with pentapeptide repeats
MIHRRFFSCVSFFILLAILAWSPAGSISQNAKKTTALDSTMIAGRNVNMVSGTQLPGGDPWLQRQNEPSIAVSTRNPLHILAGANDYRTVDMSASEGELPGIPGLSTGDAWLGVYLSVDGGESWQSTLVPGYPQDLSASPLKAYVAASDPIVRAGTNGLFYYGGLAFQRIANGNSAVFVARYIDNNNSESGSPVKYLDTKVIATGNALAFLDKPWVAVDIPRSNSTVTIDGQAIPAASVYLAYTLFYGAGSSAVTSELRFLRSTNCGESWTSSPLVLDKTTTKDQSQVQGATIAVSPKDGTVYVAWRKFDKKTQKGSIYCAKSTNAGSSFGSPEEVAKIKPFDQGASTVSFRTNGYPTMTVDNDGIVYVAWSERVQGNHGPARIMVATYGGGKKWSKNQEVDTSGQGHQFMPSIACAGGKIIVAWYDQRNDASGAFTEFMDEVNPIRHTIDVFMAEGTPGETPVFSQSVQVSRYLWALKDLGGGQYAAEQVQYNPPNYTLFKGGTIPFHGDYVDLAPAPAFVFDNGHWRYNTLSTDIPLFHIAWTDNRDVRPPADNNWTNYAPPTSVQPGWPAPPVECSNVSRAGMRNQNIYTAVAARAIEFGALGNNKPLGTLGTNPSTGKFIPRAFAVFIRNTTGSALSFRLTVAKEPISGDASFLEFGSLNSLDLDIAPFSSVSRPAFVTATNPKDTATIDINQIDKVGGSPVAGGLHGSVIINPDTTAPNVGGDLYGTETHTPNIENPNLVNWGPGTSNLINPNIINPNLENPNLVNPNLVNPNLENLNLVNPNLVNPNLVNPNLENPNLVNPNLENPNLINTSLADAQITDVHWKVTNAGNTVSSYSFKTFSKEVIPAGIYLQLLIYRVHYTPAINPTSSPTCDLKQEHHDELLANIVNPNLINPNLVNPNIENPNIENPNIENATFSLAPGEEASVILRIINPTPSMTKMVAGGRVFDPTSFASSVGAATTSHSVDSTAEVQGKTEPPATATKLVIGTAALPDAVLGVQYNATLVAFGGTTPYYWTLNSGELPTGLTLAPGTGVISGTPTVAKVFIFTVQVTDAGGQTDTQRYSIYTYSGSPATLHIDTTSLPSGVQGTVYGATLVATGGVYPRVWTLDSGTLPPGLGLDSGGVISGIPSAQGTYNFAVKATDHSGTTATKTLSITISIFTEVSWTISGTIYDSTHYPLSGVLLRGLPGAPTTGDDGTYSVLVPQGWSGTVIPFKVGYSLAPESRTYMDVIGNAAGQDYNGSEALVTQELLKRYNGSASWSDDWTAGMAMDSAGNVFVTGYSVGGSRRFEYATVKFDHGTGNKTVARYNDNDHAMGFPAAIAVDSLGNVYVTGYCYGAKIRDYIVTVKYDNNLNQLAYARHSDPSAIIDAVSITADASGNVYVAGIVYQGVATSTNDYITIKYDSSLNELWARTYSASGTSNDNAAGIAVDASGGVYVTGTTWDSGGNTDILTIKYDSVGGEAWVSRFNGSGDGDDYPVGIRVNLEGDIYIGGTTFSAYSGDDYLILKLDPDTGSALWPQPKTFSYGETSWEDASAMTVDSADNIYITGFLSGGPPGPSLTVKYDLNGDWKWTNVQNDSDYPDSGQAVSIAVDPGRNVYLGGSHWSGNLWDYFAIKLDPSGNKLWSVIKDGGSKGSDYGGQIGVDGLGNVILTGTSEGSSTGNDLYAVVFDSSGAFQYDQRYDGPPNDDSFAAMALDPAGNIAVVGQSCRPGTFLDFMTMKIDSAGNALWPQPQWYNGSSNYNDNPTSMAVDATGNVYVSGQSDNKITLIKYDATDGHPIWSPPSRQHAGQAVARWQPGLALDSSGNAYVAGSMQNPPNGQYDWDYLIMKFDKVDGHVIWERTYNRVVGSSNCRDMIKAMAIDSSGIYVTGQSRAPSGPEGDDIMTVKYDFDGNFQWVARYWRNGSDNPTRIKADSFGNVFVLGDSNGLNNKPDIVTIKYDGSTGAQLWEDRYDGPIHGADNSYGLAVDASGYAYVTGGSNSELTWFQTQDYITIKYTPGGSRAWERRYDSGTETNDTAEDIALDDQGNVYVTGMSQGVEYSSDWATVKYDKDGHMIWVIRYNGPGHSSDYAYSVLVGPASANYPVYVAGVSEGDNAQGMAIAFIKYKQK